MDGEVLAGRECGSCNVCCVALTIDDPAMQKVQGYRCRNATLDNQCAIYAKRPHTCRSFECGWRLLKWVKPGLRPDQSGVLIRFQMVEDGMGVIVTLLNAAALKAEGLAESVAAAVGAGLPVFLHVPGPPGYTSAQARIDGALAMAVATRDKEGVLAILRHGRNQGRAGPTVPIKLKPHAPPLALPGPGKSGG